MIELRNLCLHAGEDTILKDINLTVRTGETLALIGPSGAGKSSLARLLLRLLDGQGACPHKHLSPRARFHWSGQAWLAGSDVLRARAAEVHALRGRHIGLIVQRLTDALNPQLTVRAHIAEVLAQHRITAPTPEEICARYNLPPCVLDQRPASLSGGEIQRVLTALALLPQPSCLILDEPTAALDPANQALTLKAMQHGRADRAQILISHDPAVAVSLANQIAVLERGRIIETGPARQILRAPQQALTQALLGQAPRTTPPTAPARPGPVVLRVHRLSHSYGARPVLRNLTLSLRAEACLAVVGRSGCGKSTLAKLIAGLEPLQSGQIDWPRPDAIAHTARHRVGYVSQFPHRALTGHFSVAETLAETQALSQHRLRWFRRPRHGDPADEQAMTDALNAVSLPTGAAFRARRTRDLSGGEAQRLCLARALMADPTVIIADEPTSALDGRSKAEVVQTLQDLKSHRGKALLLVTHDPWVADTLADQQLELQQMSLSPRAVEMPPQPLPSPTQSLS
ncbi:ABC transporter ATP-binding protein [Epibacterium sp. Ofav1-8]|uniref:ABC transporter ATP-binding protein n=1 Tax=Epibacterium sp. Ofav1-8 TaxID=2917735 RepID=UPI001EF5421C|nr:ATP-binding cassette domain-containing protein [Epibacterium sp. Ofav1-8]MCG7625859.1 ATP-binding cassette domain-containing protein [Epibacterium sp. Ofav1-8]